MQQVWRRCSYKQLLQDYKLMPGADMPSVEQTPEVERLMRCITIFREPLDYSVENAVPKHQRFSAKLQEMAKATQDDCTAKLDALLVA